ncbi:MAG: hypothetical protein KF894_26015, partial [Labilithrix sp.]|nr:hypothetical protein [Labilithrix sp.]
MRRLALLVALASAIGLACGGGAREGRQGASAGLAGARALAGAVGPRAPGELRAPHVPVVAGGAESDGDAGACAGCHRAEAMEWSASLHHGSFTDADFQASF